MDQVNNNNAAINQTRELAQQKNNKPAFCYTHVLMPHWPYYFDSAGNANPMNIILDSKSWKDKDLYIGYLHYTNRIINKLITDMVTADPQAIIILMSDHGFRNYNNRQRYQSFQFDNFCAVRIPGTVPQPFDRSNVNLFAYLFNRAFGQRLPYLKDSTIALADENTFK